LSDNLQIDFITTIWGEPAQLKLDVAETKGDSVLVRATLLDSKGIQCFMAKNFVRFGLTGDGKLLDDMGTSLGSSAIQLYNGYALIWMKRNNGVSVVSLSSKGFGTQFIEIK
jgi:beta-galactosidase